MTLLEIENRKLKRGGMIQRENENHDNNKIEFVHALTKLKLYTIETGTKVRKRY